MNSDEYADKLKLLSGLAMLLQSCEEEKEIFEVTYWYLPRLFPHTLGTVYLENEKTNRLDQAFFWPENHKSPLSPEPGQCKAFTTGIATDVSEVKDSTCLACGCGLHCTPFRNNSDSFGLFCLSTKEGSPLPAPYKGLAFITTEYLSLAISNIRLKKRLHQMTILDPLTGLYNRRYMEDAMARKFKRASCEGSELGIIMVDLDHFKQVNDTFGHDGGDHVLTQTAKALTQGVRFEDLVCRIGGEEFFIAISKGGYKDYLKIAQGLRQRIKSLELVWNGQAIGPVTASFGVASFPADGKDFAQVLKKADQALYLAKNQGRDQVAGAKDL